MAKTESSMLDLGTKAPSFSLPDTDGNTVSLEDFQGSKALLVMFLCNHCPYVIHLREALAAFAKDYESQGLRVVGISSNDVENYPLDSPALMKEEKALAGYTFPYLYDESQAVAKRYQAACTPDFYLFDQDQKLVYRGRFDQSRPGNDIPVTGKALRAAADLLLAGESIPEDQIPSLGCGIKWKKGEAPNYL